MKTPLRFGRTVALLLPVLLPLSTTPVHASIEHAPLPAKGTGILMGAGAVLKQLEPPKAASAKKAETDTLAELKKSVKAFRTSGATLPPTEAASAWLGLADRFLAASQKQDANPLSIGARAGYSFKEIVEVLPPPTAWPAIARAVEARNPQKTKSQRDLTLSLLAHVLTEEKAKQWQDLAALRAVFSNGGGGYGAAIYSRQLAASMARVSGDKKKLLQFGGGQSIGPDAYDYSDFYDPASKGVQQLPDLVSLMGRPKAEARLRSILLTSKSQIEIPLGDDTRRLAQKLALELVPKLRVAQWRLAYSIDSMQLFKAMEARFIKPAGPATKSAPPRRAPRGRGGKAIVKAPAAKKPAVKVDQSYRTARLYYLLGLIASGRAEDSVALATRLASGKQLSEIPAQALEALDQAGHTVRLNYFLRDLLKRRPDLPLWNTYIRTAARAGQTTEMLAMVRKRAATKGVSRAQSLQLRGNLYTALLAADRVSEGIGVLRSLLPVTANAESRAGMATTLVQVGKLMGRPDWIQEGLRVLQGTGSSRSEIYAAYPGSERVALLVQVGRDAEAEKVLTASIRRVAANRDAEPGEASLYGGNLGAQAQLTELAGIYHRRGRHQDVLDLLQGAEWWGAKDLSGLLATSDSTGTPLGYMVASAYAATGDSEKALDITRALLNASNGYDPAYALLVKLEGENSLPVLDALFAGDRFEERPLIWKAAVLFKANRLPEAEAVARQAIAIDPSDGEQGKGDRMRVYAVLADIRAARGDAAQAKVLRGAVKAIRTSENADDFFAAGLLTRAIRMYELALTYFSDAYCIQSRLSIQLAAMGKTKEAAEHYRRAYELMPDSFGRMESHCFGCEGAFRGQTAATIAEGVFKKLLQKTPNKPQLHYLLGYLREEQGRPAEALVHYRRATQLDKDYINAWSKLLGIGQRMQLPQSDREAAVLNIMRLDPTFRHAVPDVTQVTQLKQLWWAMARAQKLRGDLKEGSLLPLPASAPMADKLAAARAKQYEKYGVSAEDFEEIYEESGEGGSVSRYLNPGSVLPRQLVIASLIQIMDARFQENLLSGYR